MYTFGPYPPRMTPKHRRCLHIITIERKSASRRDRSRNAWPGNLWPARSSSSVRTRVLPVCQPHSVLYVLGIPTHAINQQCHVAAIKVNPSGKEDVRKKTPDAPCNKPQIILDRFLISNNLFLLLYIWYELRCILPPSVAWGGELLAKMPTALAQNRISLPSLSGIYCTQPRTTEAGNGPKPPRNGSATFHSSTSEVNP